MNFCKDRDILYHEPALFLELHFPTQVISAGTGAVLAETSLTKTGGDFTAEGIRPGQVVHLTDGQTENLCEVVAVVSPEELRVSVLRENESAEPIAPPPGVNLSYRVCTYGPQIAEMSESLCQYLGIGRENSFGAEDIKNPESLRQVCVFSVLTNLYASLARGREDDKLMWDKCAHYYKMFEKARAVAHAEIDNDSDGLTDAVLSSSSVQMKRA